MAIENSHQEVKRIYDFCKENCSNIERWPSYFHRRYLEFLSYLAIFPHKKYDKILELGCGIGYQSAFLAQIANEVIATDLPDEDLTAHAPGMLQAKLLHDQLNIHNVKLIACSAEELPFEDNSFDMVYSSHVLEHIPDQKKALNEIYRVLKPGGIHFCVVPTSFEKVYAFINFYTYLTSRVFALAYSKFNRIFVKKFIKENEPMVEVKKGNSILRYFPFPPPHGHYLHYFNELKQWTPYKWSDKATLNHKFKLQQQLTTQFNPLLSLLGAVFPRAGTYVHSLTRKIELKLGKLWIFQLIGLNTVIVIKK